MTAKGKTVCNLKVGDVIKAHIQVNSVADEVLFSKISYKEKGPFSITADLVHHIFELQLYNDTNTAKTQIQKHRIVSPSPFFIFSAPAGYNRPMVPQQ